MTSPSDILALVIVAAAAVAFLWMVISRIRGRRKNSTMCADCPLKDTCGQDINENCQGPPEGSDPL